MLRLLADDLTGALDSAAGFVPALGPVRVTFGARAGNASAAAHDSGTREMSAGEAAAKVALLADFLMPTPMGAPHRTGIRFFKVDSLLRGNAGAELGAIVSRLPFARVIIAPALPFQGRITRNGRQCIRMDGAWQTTGEDIAATLEAAGHEVQRCTAGAPCPPGFSLWDAETDADLDRIVAAAGPGQGTLWVGAAGLSAALLRGQSSAPVSAPRLDAPLLALIGTEHPVMQRQVLACGLAVHRLASAVKDAPGIAAALQHRGIALVACDLPPATPRAMAQAHIAARFADLCRALPRPGCLFVSGGETLSGLCRALGTEALDVTGEFESGAPLSRMVGGLWPGLTIVSKSGAFGTDDFLTRLHSFLSEKST